MAAGRAPDTTGYSVARTTLRRSSNQKCVYCEQQAAERQLPVEHFRPKGLALGNLQPAAESGYWWLTWTWKNLLFACQTCNGNKRNQFPLEEGASRLPELSEDFASEAQTLIDPVRDDPLCEIQFVRLKGNWTPQGRNGSTRGQTTVECLHLGEDLIDHYNHHVDTLADYAKRVKEHLDAGDSGAALDEWQRMLGVFFSPLHHYQSLTYWVLEERFPQAMRDAHGLVLPKPGSTEADADVSSTDVAHPDWDHLPEHLQLHLRAIGEAPRTSRRWLDRALLAACEDAPRTMAQLIALTSRPEGVVRGGLNRLVDAGKLVLNEELYEPVP
ncbi:MAG: hypothetical protein GY722_17260 [bacterium]|nr:hypothetical protein [bacterium]